MKVKLLVSLAGAQTWVPGDEYECGAEEAARLLEAGFAEPLGGAVERTVKPAPAAKRGGGARRDRAVAGVMT